MRKVVYFRAGQVADFDVPDALFEHLAGSLDWSLRHAEPELEKARRALESFMSAGNARPAGPNEQLAAAFIWNYFNTNPRQDRHIKGDVMVVDLRGDGSYIEYAAVGDVQLAPDN
jgi:hypothetical protein